MFERFFLLKCLLQWICETIPNHNSVDVGQHSTARANIIRASSGSSSSTACFHKRTELGICSKALRYTRFLALFSDSKSAALIHSFTELATSLTALATTRLAISEGWSLVASSHTSSDLK